MSALAKGAMAKLQGRLNSQDMLRLGRSLKAAVDGKHLLLYANDPALRMLLAEAQADGALLPTRGDHLMVVDTNVGFNKVNPRIEQRVDYAVALQSQGRSGARLTMSYEHKGTIRLDQCVHEARYGRVYEDMMERCYWDYVRVYAPLGSTLVLGPASPDLEVAQEGDKETFATFFVLAPGGRHEATIDYLLPANIAFPEGQTRRYTLLVQKPRDQ